MNSGRLRVALAIALYTIWASPLLGADSEPTTRPAPPVILLDSFGRPIIIPRDQLPKGLRPPESLPPRNQLPTPIPGVKTSDPVAVRTARDEADVFQWFPSAQPPLASYLASIDELGNTAYRPGALIPIFPGEQIVQGAKYWLGDHGFRYSLDQTFTYVTLSDVLPGHADNFGFYTFDLHAKWAIYDSPESASAGWITSHVEAKTGLSTAGENESAQRALGSITDPTGIWSSHNSFRVPELAWQQSFDDGKLVVVAGMVDQGDYFDQNAYASSGRGQFINSALIDTMVMPLPAYNFGFNVQWQPLDDWYGIVGASIGNADAGTAPWTDFDSDFWSILCEIGYAPSDFAGMGPGVYRLQTFLARAGGNVQPGIALNFQQQLGQHSPFGWYGRFGVGGDEVTAGASAQVGTGFVMHAPLKEIGLVQRLSNDLAGIGFVWSQPTASDSTVFHENEYVLEAFYTMQLTPTIRLQPDVQVVWDPAFNPDSGPAVVFQFQFIASW